MGAELKKYGEVPGRDVLKGFVPSLSSHVRRSDLVRMGLSAKQIDALVSGRGSGTPSTIPGGSGGAGSPPSAMSPFEPKIHQVYRLMAHDHRTGRETPDVYARKGASVGLAQEIIQRAPPPEIAKKIQTAIEYAAGLSGNLDPNQRQHKRLEVDVALYFGPTITGFNERYVSPVTGRHLEVDVESDSYMVEVTARNRGKSDQISRYFSINTTERNVILYAPNYHNKQAIGEIEKIGGQVVHDYLNLTSLIKKMTP